MNKFNIENPIVELSAAFDGLLERLLLDRSTGNNIVWATSDYAAIDPRAPITASDVHLIEPRFMKHKARRTKRTKSHAEVFTPPEVCRLQNDLLDEHMRSLPLDDYIDARFLEITCGEAPYLASRYNVVDGRPIELDERVGLLDRKLRRINSLEIEPERWRELVRRAYQSIYGYEFQGDNLLLARCNLLLTAVDYHRVRYQCEPPREFLLELAEIISWNIFQFDGLKNSLPFNDLGVGLFNCCQIYDWIERVTVEFPGGVDRHA